MSLTAEDITQIRRVISETVRDEVSSQLISVHDKLDRLEGKLEALENDVKEIYKMLTDIQKQTSADKTFMKLSVEAKLFRLNAELLAAAKQAGITLPRS